MIDDVLFTRLLFLLSTSTVADSYRQINVTIGNKTVLEEGYYYLNNFNNILSSFGNSSNIFFLKYDWKYVLLLFCQPFPSKDQNQIRVGRYLSRSTFLSLFVVLRSPSVLTEGLRYKVTSYQKPEYYNTHDQPQWRWCCCRLGRRCESCLVVRTLYSFEGQH